VRPAHVEHVRDDEQKDDDDQQEEHFLFQLSIFCAKPHAKAVSGL
jgi:hypothetical protein